MTAHPPQDTGPTDPAGWPTGRRADGGGILVGVVITVLLARSLNTIALGEDLAVSLGTHVNRTRVLAIVAVTLLCGAATAVAGPIGFIGLMVPHVARWVVGPHQSWIMLYTLLGAPVLLLCSDVLGRVVVAGEMQVGVVTWCSASSSRAGMANHFLLPDDRVAPNGKECLP